MSHWIGDGHAPGYSREMEAASEAVKAAEKALLIELMRSYAMGAPVRVIHHRGEFSGTVVGHDVFGVRVLVRNDVTGKRSKWWAGHVQLNDSKEGTPDAAIASAAQPEREPHPPRRDCGCAECAPSFETDEPTLTVTMRYDLSPDAIEGAIRNRLIEMGWTPPDAAAPKTKPAGPEGGA